MERLTYFNERKKCYDWHCTNHEVADRLAAYEDAEEQGLFVRLPCKVGDTYYCITRQCGSARVEETKLRYQYIEAAIRGLGKWAFSTREEAEAALADMREDT